MTELLLESLMITGFVAAMMLVIEYLNVATGGRWSERLARGRFSQYLLALALGVVPGCLGPFTVVTLYAHGAVSFGAVAAAMIASSGDESFVMLALVPKAAVALTALLAGLGLLVGAAVDLVGRLRPGAIPRCEALVIHPGEKPSWPSLARLFSQWRNCSAARGILAAALLLFAGAVGSGLIGPPEWDWVRVSLLASAAASLLVVATAPDHFLEEHLWRHVARKHVPRVFLWTLAALAASGPLAKAVAVSDAAASKWWLLLLASLVGLIPESGPHLVFVMLYAQHAIPFSVLLASSAVQDGHGMLPMLAHSRRAFLAVKAVNFVAGLAAGAVLMALGS